MRRVRVCIEVAEGHYQALDDEARRRGVAVQKLIEKTVQGLLDELEREEKEGTANPVIIT